MDVWNKVCQTDPKHTKHVAQRGGFTAIGAMYQIQRATEVFGAAGDGWGWSYGEPHFLPNGTVAIKCTLWHGKRENTVEQYGQKKMGDNARPDEDAFKKACTDGLTKCLSYLGFSADVFLGKFDDNKYVESLLKAERASSDYLIKLTKIKTAQELSQLKKDNADVLKRFKDSYVSLHETIERVTNSLELEICPDVNEKPNKEFKND
jgi:hypothetical protein